MRWIEVRVLAPEIWLELVADALTQGPCTSVAFGRSSLASESAPEGFDYVRTFIAEHADSPHLRAEISSRIAELARSSGAIELDGLQPCFRVLAPEDYANSWKKSWKPFRIGRLAVVAPGGRRQPRHDEVRMVLEPGGAFGSGRHATTRACLRVIQERVRPGQRILDAGTGSGILAVAAVLFGASSALGFDVDPNARPYATALARANGVGDRCRFESMGFEVLARLDHDFDAVFANIYADVVREYAHRLASLLKPDGWYVFSGCHVDHVQPTRAAISGAGLAIDDIRVRGRWHTFVGTQRQ